MHKSKKSRSGFTLVELLVVIAIVAILSIVVVLAINVPEVLRQSRDSSRIADMKTLNGAVTFYQNELPNGPLGTPTIIYVSLPDKTLSGNTTSNCASLGLPTPPTGYTYQCSSPQSYRKIDGTGWMPVNFTQLASGLPISVLPIDPTNQSSTNLYYTYATSGGSYVFTAIPESQKQKQALGTTLQIPKYPDVIAQGTDVTADPLFNASGLVGYWPMDEGVGSASGVSQTQDQSGSGNAGTWYGTAAGTNSTYYGAGKVGSYAGYFNGSNNYVSSTYSGANLSSCTISFWSKINVVTAVQGFVGWTQGSSGNFWQLRLTNSSDGTPSAGNDYLELRSTSAGNTIYANSSPISANIWHHFVWEGNGTTYTVYVDGILVPVVAINGSNSGVCPSVVSSANTYLGTEYYNGSLLLMLNGYLDDVRFYNRALSAAEIQTLYNAEK